MQIAELSPVVVITLSAISLGIVTASPAAAGCENAGGVTVCTTGPDLTGTTTVLPYYPYPCEDDWLCADGGISLLETGGGLNAGRDTPGGLYTD